MSRSVTTRIKRIVCRNGEGPGGAPACPRLGLPMRLRDEQSTYYCFHCDTCGADRIVTKRRVGGSWGNAGHRRPVVPGVQFQENYVR